jgi:hypothetical protein
MSDSAAAAATVGYYGSTTGGSSSAYEPEKQREPKSTISTSLRWKTKRNKVTRLQGLALGIRDDC